jgi:hypothetical protein
MEIGNFILLILAFVIYLNMCRPLLCPFNIIFFNTKTRLVGWMLKNKQACAMVNFEVLLLHNKLPIIWDCTNFGHVFCFHILIS